MRITLNKTSLKIAGTNTGKVIRNLGSGRFDLNGCDIGGYISVNNLIEMNFNDCFVDSGNNLKIFTEDSAEEGMPSPADGVITSNNTRWGTEENIDEAGVLLKGTLKFVSKNDKMFGQNVFLEDSSIDAKLTDFITDTLPALNINSAAAESKARFCNFKSPNIGSGDIVVGNGAFSYWGNTFDEAVIPYAASLNGGVGAYKLNSDT